jgi:hypothetical protein
MSKPIARIDLRAEATVNANWIVMFADGEVRRFYSVDQETPLDEDTDMPLYDEDPGLSNFLSELWYSLPIEDTLESDVYDATFDGKGKLLSLKLADV